MPADPLATEYRRRAAELRALADELEASAVLRLHEVAGADTWSSPAVHACRTTLADDQVRLRSAAVELRQHACWYEHQADALDAIATAGRLAAGG
jgi:hypothetical protein